MHILGGTAQVYLLKERTVIRVLGKSPVFFLEDRGILALDRVAVGIVFAIAGHRVDEEETEHLDSLRPQPHFFVEVFFDRAANHLSLERQRFQVAVGLADAQEVLTAWNS